jgi:ribose/xylose/arabinose/galactoside ABC-type transport system permease subunit
LRIKASNLNQKVMFLSGGNQQKVVLSKWLCSQADIFIFDEPTRGIDVGSKVEIYELMNRLTARGVAIIAVGMTFVIITAGIDLSVGSIVAFSGVVLASVLRAGVPVPVALLAGLAAGLVCGLANGLFITRGNLPPFISTLGMMSVLRGGALLYTGGRPISGFSESFRFLATTEVLHIPFPVIIMVVVYLVAHFVLTRTKVGRYAYAIGGNEEATVSGFTMISDTCTL